jgi:hypothetical protein
LVMAQLSMPWFSRIGSMVTTCTAPTAPRWCRCPARWPHPVSPTRTPRRRPEHHACDVEHVCLLPKSSSVGVR